MCDRARIDVSNIPSDKVSDHLHLNESPKLPSASSVSECVNG